MVISSGQVVAAPRTSDFWVLWLQQAVTLVTDRSALCLSALNPALSREVSLGTIRYLPDTNSYCRHE